MHSTVSVSVLVAVYNTEAYLPQCLDSLLAQTQQDIQVLCVDDCSTDGSWEILQDYARRDPRIEISRMVKNSGQAKARNEALHHVRGQYVAFLDSDDWLDSRALELVVQTFSQQPDSDCVLMRLLRVCQDDSKYDYEKLIPQFMTGKEAFDKSLDWTIHGVYVARASLYKQWPFDDTCRSFSDDNTTRLHYYFSRRVSYCHEACYYYRVRPQSVSAQVSRRRFDYLRANESMRRQLIDMNVGQEYVAKYENHRWLNLVGVYMFYHVNRSKLSRDDRQYGLSEMHRVWENIDLSLLDRKTTAKFGYRPCSSWLLFRLQEWLYFTLRDLLGRNR
jgi:glycosyltransferase involved in cell wall biosynthesis